MNALPALTSIANAAVRRQFESAGSPSREPEPARSTLSHIRLAVAAALERAARAVAPAGYHRPAH
jgi:hypothetical protein